MPKKLTKYKTDFLKYLKTEKNRSDRTIKNYDLYLERFMECLGKNKTPADITQEKVKKYREWLEKFTDKHGEKLKNNTQNYHLIALRVFLEYLSKQDINSLSAEKIELADIPDRDIEIIKGKNLKKLLNAPIKYKKEGNNGELIAHRDKAILETLSSTGLKVSELAKQEQSSVNISKEKLKIKEKENKHRTVFISDQAREWINKYLNLRKDKNPYLFISHDKRTYSDKKREDRQKEHKPISVRSIQRLVKKYVKLTGLTKEVTPHSLRHSFAVQKLRDGADLKEVQQLLGHSHISTTKFYSSLVDSQNS